MIDSCDLNGQSPGPIGDMTSHLDDNLRFAESIDDGIHPDRGLRVTLVEESILASGPLVHTTVAQLLGAIAECADRGLLEVVVDLSAVTDLDSQAITAVSIAQQRAGSEGRVLRVRTSDRSMRAALTGCHIEPGPVTDLSGPDRIALPLSAPDAGYRAWPRDS